jgi:hypothetical protein
VTAIFELTKVRHLVVAFGLVAVIDFLEQALMVRGEATAELLTQEFIFSVALTTVLM